MTEQKQWRVVWLAWTETENPDCDEPFRSSLPLSLVVHKGQTKQRKGCSKGWWSACFNIRQGIKMPENNEFGNRVGCRPSFYCYNQNVFVVLLIDHNRSVRSMQNPRVLDAEVDSEQTQKIIQLIARLFSLRHSIFWFLIASSNCRSSFRLSCFITQKPVNVLWSIRQFINSSGSCLVIFFHLVFPFAYSYFRQSIIIPDGY